MRVIHDLLLGASSIMLDLFAGDPVAMVTVTIPGPNAVANDFGRVSSDLQKAIELAQKS